MIGSGHISDMISRMKNNENLRKKASSFRVKHIYHVAAIKKRLRFKKATEEELEAIRQMSKTERKKDILKTAGAFFITGMIAFGVIYLLILGTQSIKN
ncbi:MAG: hypothetical protein WCX31_12605 [Salinivirgaceae bacterium]|jgi:hypothetical protein